MTTPNDSVDGLEQMHAGDCPRNTTSSNIPYQGESHTCAESAGAVPRTLVLQYAWVCRECSTAVVVGDTLPPYLDAEHRCELVGSPPTFSKRLTTHGNFNMTHPG